MIADLPRTLFVGQGVDPSCWQRCALPATALGADWIGVAGVPGRLGVVTGALGTALGEEDLERYDVVVLQRPQGRQWTRRIDELQAAGVVVLFETDAFFPLEPIPPGSGGDGARRLSEAERAGLEEAMRACDGVLCATEVLARHFAAVNARVFTCRNGLDPARFALTRPARPTVNLGWAGTDSEERVMRPWLKAVASVMAARPDTRFVSIGQDLTRPLRNAFGERCLALPTQSVEDYPGALCHVDVLIAPSGREEAARARSDLRWLEGSALGIPVVGDAWLHPEIEDGVTGYRVGRAADAQARLLALASDERLRRRVGDAARAHVLRERTTTAMAPQWADALRAMGVSASAGTSRSRSDPGARPA